MAAAPIVAPRFARQALQTLLRRGLAGMHHLDAVKILLLHLGRPPAVNMRFIIHPLALSPTRPQAPPPPMNLYPYRVGIKRELSADALGNLAPLCHLAFCAFSQVALLSLPADLATHRTVRLGALATKKALTNESRLPSPEGAIAGSRG